MPESLLQPRGRRSTHNFASDILFCVQYDGRVYSLQNTRVIMLLAEQNYEFRARRTGDPRVVALPFLKTGSAGELELKTRHIVYVPQFVCTRPEPNGRASAPFENRRTMNSADRRRQTFQISAQSHLLNCAERTHIDYNTHDSLLDQDRTISKSLISSVNKYGVMLLCSSLMSG